MPLILIVVAVAVVVLALVAVAGVRRGRREPDHSTVPPGTHSRSSTPPIGAQDTNDPVAPPEVAVDMPTDMPDDAPEVAAPEAGIPSPSKRDR